MRPIVRATVVLVEDGKILLVEEDGGTGRSWSLPGGKLEAGETMQACAIRETREETGLEIEVVELLYVCDRIQGDRHVLHITFLVKRLGGVLEAGPAAEVVKQVQMVPLESLCDYGYTSRFRDLAMQGFPNRGSYRGPVENIGL